MEDGETSYVIFVTDQAEAERDTIFLQLTRVLGPEYAGRWVAGLQKAIDALSAFPGPLSHAIDTEASEHYGREVRRLLYHGPGRRSGAAYRVLFLVISPGEQGDDAVVRVFRILHGAQSLTGGD